MHQPPYRGADAARTRGAGADGRGPYQPGIAQRLWLTERIVETHVGNILAKLELPLDPQDHRRVLAVITYLQAQGWS